MEKTTTGKLSVTGSDIYIAPVDTLKKAFIKSMRFTCDVDFSIEVYKRYLDSGNKDLIYKLNLSAGDVVTDSFPYILNLKESLFVIGSNSNINYLISILEDVNTNNR